MKFCAVFVLILATLLCSVGCGVNTSNPADPKLTPSSHAATAQTYDMMNWLMMNSTLSATHHMAGTANPLYTSKTSSRFFWTKTAAGYPWDIQLYDNNFVYLWVTELNWQPKELQDLSQPEAWQQESPVSSPLGSRRFSGFECENQ